jgi:Tfp pilus assembly protein PilO
VSGGSVWLRWWWAWALPALLLTVNIVWLGGLRGAVLGRGSLMGRRVTELEGEVKRLDARRRQLDTTKHDLDTLEERLASLRDAQLAPMRERLVPFLVDVVERARTVGLNPQRIGYSVSEDKKSGLFHFVATYGLEGRYDQMRQLIYLLESSPQFIVIERLGLSGQDDASSLEVSVSLGLGTYFSDVDKELMHELGVTEVQRGEE